MPRSLLHIVPIIIDLSLKLDGSRLSLSLGIIDYATYVLMMWLGIRHTCIVLECTMYSSVEEIRFTYYSRMQS
jgi:hypothetical protein